MPEPTTNYLTQRRRASDKWCARCDKWIPKSKWRGGYCTFHRRDLEWKSRVTPHMERTGELVTALREIEQAARTSTFGPSWMGERARRALETIE